MAGGDPLQRPPLLSHLHNQGILIALVCDYVVLCLASEMSLFISLFITPPAAQGQTPSLCGQKQVQV